METHVTEQANTRVVEELFPPTDASLVEVEVPVTQVTLLEDRAMVRREATIKVTEGLQRFRIRHIAPVIQDVSLKAEVGVDGIKVADIRARRAMRVRREERSQEARGLEQQIDSMIRQYENHQQKRKHLELKYGRTVDVIVSGLYEVSTDAGWGLLQTAQWRDTYENLFRRTRELRTDILGEISTLEDLSEQVTGLSQKRQALDRADTAFVAWIEVDVVCNKAGEMPLLIEYVVPNALWRPMHQARLRGNNTVEFISQAVVWQNTGEDWTNANLIFSTARSSLGHEPPVLTDDLLQAQKKNDQLVVQVRQVAVQKASAGAAPVSTGIELPGVDDGGDIRTLRAEEKRTIPSNGRAHVVPLFTFTADADAKHVAVPELDPKVFLKATFRNTARSPVLAGPVELMGETGHIGWTKTLFVAPQESMALSFGPNESLRIVRQVYTKSSTQREDKWKTDTTEVFLFVSNLSGEDYRIEVTERIPVSEIPQVKVEYIKSRSTPAQSFDENGFWTVNTEVAANSTNTAMLTFSVSTAPDVKKG